MSKISALLAQAAVIRDATAEKENTALRVGSMFVSFIQAVLDTMPPEVIDATGITLTSAADKITVTLKTLDEDGAADTRSIVIPTATTDKAGLLSPATLKAISKAVADVATAVQAATDAVTTANAAKTTAGLAQGRANYAVNIAETSSTTAGEAKTVAGAAKTAADAAVADAAKSAQRVAGVSILPIGATSHLVLGGGTPDGVYFNSLTGMFEGDSEGTGYTLADYAEIYTEGEGPTAQLKSRARTDCLYRCGTELYHIKDGQLIKLHSEDLDDLSNRISATDSRLTLKLAGLHIMPVDGIGITGDDLFPNAAPGIYWDTEDREFIGRPDVNGYDQEDYFVQDSAGEWRPRTDVIFSCKGALYHIVAGQMVPLHQADLDTLVARVTTAETRLAGVAILPIDATVNLGTVAGAQQEGIRFDTTTGAFVGDFAAAGYAEEDYNEKYSESDLVLPTWRARRDRIYRCGAELYHITETGALKPLHATEAELSEAVEDIGHRLVGIWDELDSVKDALAALSSPRLDRLLARLGYDEADIREFRYALLHFDLGLTLDDIELAAMRWEARAELSYPLGLKLMPKWGAGCEWTDSGEFATIKDLAKATNYEPLNECYHFTYIPHIGTMLCAEAQAFIDKCPYMVFFGGVDIRDKSMYVRSRLSMDNKILLRGVGRVFAEDFYAYHTMTYIGKARINVCDNAFYGTHIQDFRGVEFREDSPRWQARRIFGCDVVWYNDVMIGDWDFAIDKLSSEGFAENRIIKGSVLSFDWKSRLSQMDGSVITVGENILRNTGLNGCTINIKGFYSDLTPYKVLGLCYAVENPTIVNILSVDDSKYSSTLDLSNFRCGSKDLFGDNVPNAGNPSLTGRNISHFEVHLCNEIVNVISAEYHVPSGSGNDVVHCYIFDYGGNTAPGTQGSIDLRTLCGNFYADIDTEPLVRSLRSWHDRTAPGLLPFNVTIGPGIYAHIPEEDAAELAAKGYNIIVPSY